uniref:40S ribosomal protein S27 n=1 Tax=Bos indicus x Bos taurus TaxID=30522 RepID=A0A4W2FIB7_BOBOX
MLLPTQSFCLCYFFLPGILFPSCLDLANTSIGGGGGLVAKSCPSLATPWTVACQAHLSMGFSRQEYWSGLPFPSPTSCLNINLTCLMPRASSRAARWGCRLRDLHGLGLRKDQHAWCYKITTVFSHAQTVVLCVGCSTVLCQPTGGKARLTEGCLFRRKQH